VKTLTTRSGGRLYTPATSLDVALWLATLDADSVAYVQGAAMQRMAMALGMSEADVYAHFAKRAAEDPDANVVRNP
jgi:hypothetical protein